MSQLEDCDTSQQYCSENRKLSKHFGGWILFPTLVLIAWKVMCLHCAAIASVVTWTKSSLQSKTDITELIHKLQSIQFQGQKPDKEVSQGTDNKKPLSWNSQEDKFYCSSPNLHKDFRSTHTVPRYLWWCNDTNSAFVQTSVGFLSQSYLDQQWENLLGLSESVEWPEGSSSLPATRCSPPEGSHSFHGKPVLLGMPSLF